MEVTKDIEELEKDGNELCIQQAKWPEECGHCFWAVKDPSHPLLEWPSSPHDGPNLVKKEK
jgi:hypothetical protein